MWIMGCGFVLWNVGILRDCFFEFLIYWWGFFFMFGNDVVYVVEVDI